MTEKKCMLIVFGTRPEAIKMAPLVHALRKQDDLETKVCVTAQHRHMLDQVLQIFRITPDVDLNVMKDGQDLTDVTVRVLEGMKRVLREVRPAAVLVHGDTTTAFCAALSAFYAGIPVGHVEAGLRTFDLRAPFPEEFNRQVVGRVAQWHFAPTAQSRANLLGEGVAPERIFVTGNTVIDALFQALESIDRDPQRRDVLEETITRMLGFDWTDQPYVLITGHRRENFGDGFVEICDGLRIAARRHPAVHFVYPVHLNPNVRGPVMSRLGGIENIHIIEPVDYERFLLLLRQSRIVLTDSGGIQEEAPSLGKPVLVMREVTERPEAVAAGTVRLVGACKDTIVSALDELLLVREKYDAMTRAHNPYGDGNACSRIVDALRGAHV